MIQLISSMTSVNIKKRALDSMISMPVEPKDSQAKRRRLLVPGCKTVAVTTPSVSRTKRKRKVSSEAEDAMVLMEPQASPAKRKRKVSSDAEDTMVLMELQASPAKRRRLCVPCCGSVTAMAKLDSWRNKYKGKRASKKTLRLNVVPFASQVRRWNINASKYHHVKVKESNMVDGEVQGKKCEFIVDSGGTLNTSSYSFAKQLGVITGKEKKVLQRILMWGGYQLLKVTVLEKVTITLGGCTMTIPIHVYPRSLEQLYHLPSMIILGLEFLRPGRVIQEFSGSDTSTLYIRKPERVETRPNRDWIYDPIVFRAVKEGGTKPIPVLVDTGALGFFTTNLLKKQDGAALQTASLQLRDGSFMDTPLEVRQTQDEFYVLGCNLLHKYDAIMDYGSRLLTFKVDDKYLRVTNVKNGKGW